MDDILLTDARISLLTPDEAPAAVRINAGGKCDLVLVCDHASNRVPRALGDLGIEASHYERHISYDIGAEAVTRILAEELDATAVLAGYSRLVVDLNRPPGHPAGMPVISDDTVIPANQNLTADDITARLDDLFEPYHNLVRQSLSDVWAARRPPALFSVHSFTPRMGDTPRPWDVGILWNRDGRLAKPLIKALHDRGMDVGDNLPYSGQDLAYTLNAHAGSSGLANCVIEINQDQVADASGINRWATVLTEVLRDLIKDDNLFRSENY